MKRIVKLLCLAFIMALVLMPARILATDARVVDDASLLSQQEYDALTDALDEISERQQCDVLFHTTNNTSGKTTEAYADDFYDYNDYGYGSDRTGLVLVIDMDNRYVQISTCGKAIQYFTDYGIDAILDEVVPYVSSGDYYDAAMTYARMADDYITQAKTDKPVDYYYNRLYIHLNDADGKRCSGAFDVYDSKGAWIGTINVYGGNGYLDIVSSDDNAQYIIKCRSVEGDYEKPEDRTVRGSAEYDIVINLGKEAYDAATSGAIAGGGGLTAALIACGIIKGKNKSVAHKYEARDYARRGSMHLLDQHDVYLYSTTSVTRIVHDDDRSSVSSSGHGGSFSGGSSTHTSSSGTTHGGGGRGF